MKNRHFVSIDRTSLPDLFEIFEATARQKQMLAEEGRLPNLFEAKTLGMLFEKPSLRTRVSFEVAMNQLGGKAIFLGQNEVQIGQREAVCDFARVLSRYVDAITARVFKHRHVVELAKNSSVPVINALSDYAHPCQGLADLWTIMEHVGMWEGVRLTYLGDANNVARSLGFLCAKLGLKYTIASPSGYGFDKQYLKRLEKCVENKTFTLREMRDPKAAVRNADVIYTDVWASMGQEAEKEQRRKAFAPYQVNNKLLKHAKKEAIVLHCLPAHRGEEIADEVMDGPQAAMYDQAENRLHTERALLTLLMAGG